MLFQRVHLDKKKTYNIMTQKEIIKYYEENGGLRCKGWKIREIQKHVKDDLNVNLVTPRTAILLKRTAEIYQR